MLTSVLILFGYGLSLNMLIVMANISFENLNFDRFISEVQHLVSRLKFRIRVLIFLKVRVQCYFKIHFHIIFFFTITYTNNFV